jgi:hypothetical protein
LKFKLRNIGAIKYAEMEIGDLTILCGTNNTGKTYATYALYGFLFFWQDAYSIITVKHSLVRKLLEEGSIEINIQQFVDSAQELLRKGCEAYSDRLASVFASSAAHFAESDFSVELNGDDIQPVGDFERTMGAAKSQLFAISKKEGSSLVAISLLVEKEKVRIPEHIVGKIIGDSLKDIVFEGLFPRPFIASAERTGAAIFRKELNFARNRLFEEMGASDKNIDPLELFSKVYSDYAQPIRANVDFTRQLETLSKNDSFISLHHPDLLSRFSDIIGGSYLVTKDEQLYYVPAGKRMRLTMDESSSSVRSLLDIGFYLRHVAHPGDLLIIDEPELNLHPSNQRRLARLFAELVNLGIKVFITTHSDYIIKELNTLIMLYAGGDDLTALANREGYRNTELLDPKRVAAYMADYATINTGLKRRVKCQTLLKSSVDPRLGIEVPTFDATIDEMNRIQDEILWGSRE